MSTVAGRLPGSCCASLSNASVLRASKATFAPRADSAIAVDSPIPDEAPVTMKTRSLICIVRSSCFNSTNIHQSTGCSSWRRGCDIGLSFVIAHLFEIGDQSRPGRAPCQPLPGERARGWKVSIGECSEPSEMGRGLIQGYGNDRHLQAPADDFRNVAQRHSLFGNGVIPRAWYQLLQRQPVETSRIE